MKTFIDPNEEFLIRIPKDWNFIPINDDLDQPYGFRHNKYDYAFQISYKPIPEDLKSVDIEYQLKGKTDLKFIETEAKFGYLWKCYIEGEMMVLITLFFDEKSEEIISELKSISISLNSLLILNDEKKQKYLPLIRWENFMIYYASSFDLFNRALLSSSYIELIVLINNIIDAVLRQSLVLNYQIKTKSLEIIIDYIFQTEEGKKYNEKLIYKLSFDNEIIDKEIYDQLYKLYDIRNKVIHRFIISDIKTFQIKNLLDEYYKIYQLVSDNLSKQEQYQFDNKIGIYNRERSPNAGIDKENLEMLISQIKDKHSDERLNKNISF